jgi:hypothetical protein
MKIGKVPGEWTYGKGRAVVTGGDGGALAPPKFGISEKRTEREMVSLLLSVPPTPKFESLTTALELLILPNANCLSIIDPTKIKFEKKGYWAKKTASLIDFLCF